MLLIKFLKMKSCLKLKLILTRPCHTSLFKTQLVILIRNRGAKGFECELYRTWITNISSEQQKPQISSGIQLVYNKIVVLLGLTRFCFESCFVSNVLGHYRLNTCSTQFNIQLVQQSNLCFSQVAKFLQLYINESQLPFSKLSAELRIVSTHDALSVTSIIKFHWCLLLTLRVELFYKLLYAYGCLQSVDQNMEYGMEWFG